MGFFMHYCSLCIWFLLACSFLVLKWNDTFFYCIFMYFFQFSKPDHLGIAVCTLDSHADVLIIGHVYILKLRECVYYTLRWS